MKITREISRILAMPPATKIALMIGADAIFLPACMVLAVSLRLGGFQSAIDTTLVLQIILAWLAIPPLALAGLYRTVVRYIDLKVIIASSVALAAAVLVTYGFAVIIERTSSPLAPRQMPRSVLLIFWYVAFAYVVASRFVVRAMLQRSLGRGGRPRVVTAIYGAGAAGVQLAQAMAFSIEYRPACFFDDSVQLKRKTVAGLRVYGAEGFRTAILRHSVDQIVIAIPSATPADRRKLMERIESLGLPVKILPCLSDWVDGTASLSDIRDLDVVDLLGREPVPPTPGLIARNVADKVVMVTGAGGSIGSELCRQILRQRPATLLLLDHSEFSLYSIDRELRIEAQGIEVISKLGSVQDEALLFELMSSHRVQTVYHAAAYKHVPLVEDNIQQGLRNNVFGSRCLAQAARRANVETCVLVSTDKAVRPTNVMGASKRVAELIFQAVARQPGRTTFCMVRFGNVLGSSGSVVPLFRQQIQTGGPITITHQDIIRYFMLIPEAAQLVIQAGAMAKGGEVFVLNMGEPVRIVDLARSMIHLSGLSERTSENPNGDIEIKAVGLRPGEKLYEELLIGDNVAPSDHARIMCARERYIEPTLLGKMLDKLGQACESNDIAGMYRLLCNLVPEFRSADEVNAELRSKAL